ETEIDVIEEWINIFNADQAECVGRKVSVLVERNDELIVFFRVRIGHRLDLGNLNIRDALSAFQPKEFLKAGFFFAQLRRKLAEKKCGERQLIVADFDIIKTIQAFG